MCDMKKKIIIYLDAEVFQGIQYNCENKKLLLLVNLARISVLELRITSVNNAENIIRIRKKINEIKKIYKKK